MMKSPDARQVASHRLICCAVQYEEYCFELAQVQSITRSHQLLPVTASADEDGSVAPIGWVAVHEQKLPVYDLAERLHLPPTSSSDGFIMVLKADPPFAVRVDRITGSVEVAPSQLTTLPPIVTAGTKIGFKSIAQMAEKWLLCADAQQVHPQAESRAADFVMPSTAPRRALTPTTHRTAAQILMFFPALPASPEIEAEPLVFGLSITQVQQVTKPTPILPVPSAPPYVIGITNWRNQPIPVIELRARLGLATKPTTAVDPHSRLLIARAPNQAQPLGFLVNPQVKTFRLPIPYQPLQRPLAVDMNLVKGIFELEGSPFVIPDLDAMLTRNFVPCP